MSLFAELKRRNVLRVAMICIAVSLAALEKLLDESGEPWPNGLARLNAWIGDNDEAFRQLYIADEGLAGILTSA